MADTFALPCISLWQPWASLLFTATPMKIHETRHWPAPAALIGRRVAVHAAKRCPIVDEELDELCRIAFGDHWRKTLPRGAFVGTALLAGSFRMVNDVRWNGAENERDWECGDWEPGRFAWRMDDRRPLPIPVPGKGQQGWWRADIPVSYVPPEPEPPIIPVAAASAQLSLFD